MECIGCKGVSASSKSGDVERLDKPFGEDAVYVDTCIFLFDLLERPEHAEKCRAYLKSKDHQLVTSTTAFHEMIHPLMIDELVRKHKLKNNYRALDKAREDPESVVVLNELWKKLDRLKDLNLIVLDTTPEIINRALEIIRKYGLLTADAIHAAVCFEHGITRIASSDPCFELLPGLDVWKP